MDPITNIAEQREIANAIVNEELRDPETGMSVGDLEHFASLVLALDGWRRSGGFDPYSTAPDPNLGAAIKIIEGLADQQAMEDDWYVAPLARLREIADGGDGDQPNPFCVERAQQILGADGAFIWPTHLAGRPACCINVHPDRVDGFGGVNESPYLLITDAGDEPGAERGVEGWKVTLYLPEDEGDSERVVIVTTPEGLAGAVAAHLSVFRVGATS